MKKIIYFFVLMSAPLLTMGQVRTVIATGAWNVGTTWQSGDIADVVGEDVDFTTGEKTASVPIGYTPTVGNVDLGSSGSLSVDGTLNIGDASNARNVVGSSGRSISVTGTLIIWGDVVISGIVNWAVTGTVVIKGNLIMGDNSTISNNGSFTVDGDFTSGTNTIVSNSAPGAITVGGPVTVDTGSILTNAIGATFTALSCSGPSTFCSGVLPVILKSFTCDTFPRENVLTWITTMEYNFDRFIIERSLNGEDFSAIGEVFGSGRNLQDLETAYAFTDKNPFVGKNYYRLKSVDLDGTYEYSKIVIVRWEGSKNISIYPNPSKGSLIWLSSNFQPSEKTVVQIFDRVGAILAEFELPALTTNKLHFQNQLKPGNYFLRYLSQQYVQVIKFSVDE